MLNSREDSTPLLDTHLRNEDHEDHEDEDMHNHDLMQQAANINPVDPFEQRRSIHFIASLNGSLAGPRDFVYYDTTLDTNMPALATNSLRLCTEPNDLPPGTDTLTYPGYHQQIASVSGLHAAIIEDRSPLLAAAFEDSRSGRRLHLETLSSNTVMPFLRFLYTGSYALFGGWEDVPTSVLLHCKMYWLGDLYDLPELKSQAYVNVLRQFEFGCSSPDKPIDLCSAIDFAYKTLAGHDTISDAIVQYCVTQCLSHKLHEDPEFKSLAFNVRAFHQDLTRVCRDRGYEDESSAMIIRLPYKHFAPDIYASLENPPIAGFDDIIHHFHSSDRFDEEPTPRPRQKLAPQGQASPSEMLQPLGPPEQATTAALYPSPENVKPFVPAVALPIRQLDPGRQALAFTSGQQEQSEYTNTTLPFRQLDDALAKLSTAPPNIGFFARPPPQEVTSTSSTRPLNSSRIPRTDASESDHLFAKKSPFWRSPVAKYREKRVTFDQKPEDNTTNDDKMHSPERRQGRVFLEVRPARYKYTELYPSEPQHFNGASDPTENPFADCMSSQVSPLEFPPKLSESQPSAPGTSEHAKEIKRRKVEGQDRKDFVPTDPYNHLTSAQSQWNRSVAPSSSHESWSQSNRKSRIANLQNVNVTDAARFTPSNVSPTLPPTVFGLPQSSTSPSRTNLGPENAAKNTPMPVQAVQSQSEPVRIRMPNMNPHMNTNLHAAPVFPAHPNSGNHALQDYQMQLMLLEQQNKKRLLMARQEQDSMLSRPDVPPVANGQSAPNIPPQGSRLGGPSPDLIDMARAPDALDESYHEERKVVTGFEANSADGRGREFDVLDNFDFDAFLKTEEPNLAMQSDFFWHDHQEDKNQLENLINEDQRQQMQAIRAQQCFSRVHIPTSGHQIPVVQPRTMTLPATTRKWYGAQSSNLGCSLTNLNPSDGPIMEPMDVPPSSTMEALSASPSVPTPPAERTTQPAKVTSDSEVDMCDSDSDSDMSWVDVPSAEHKSEDSTQSPDATVTPPASDLNSARAGDKRRSSSSDSEWDFC
jgi:hypothetical protein